MPNHCQNYLLVDGKTEAVEQFMKTVKSTEAPLDFGRIIMSHSERPTKEWGTKWNAYRIHTPSIRLCYPGSEYSEVLYAFQTAWSPPIPVIKKLIEMFPDCSITCTYFEQGMQYCGEISGGPYIPEGIRQWESGYEGALGG